MTDRPIHVVGGGIAGLVAAVTAAEAGAPVVLHEASDHLGGRALGGTSRTGINLGPHVVFTDGALVRWVRDRNLGVSLRRPPLRGIRLLDDNGAHLPLGEVLRLAVTVPRREAPVDATFREWADTAFGRDRAALLCRLTGLYTYHHDPGSLSARFVWDRYRRSFLATDRVRYVAGGWSALVDALEARAAALGVTIETEARVEPGRLPDGPTVVAVSLAQASRLLERRLRWPGARTALLDVVSRAGPRWPTLVADVRSDLTTCCMIERETAVEPALVEDGAELFQAHLGVAPGTGAAAGIARIEDALDRAVPGWRERTIWRRGHVVADSTGAVDPPGATWRDRPKVEQEDNIFLAGDAVAAPGMLSEVSVNSAVRAAHLALNARRRRVFAPGWPEAGLTPARRLTILAAAVPGASLSAATVRDDDPAVPEPAEETGPGYRLDRRGPFFRAVGLAPTPEGDAQLLTLTAGPGPAPARRALARLLQGRPRPR